MTKDEALKMAIKAMECDICLGQNWHLDNAIKACKDALEQPAPSWQGLSDDEIAEIIGHTVEFCHESGMMGEARAMEQALCEKNT